MNIKSLISQPDLTWSYLERYINKGSPSGYTRKYPPPEKYDPFSDNKFFYLDQFKIKRNNSFTYGHVPEVFDEFNEELVSFYFHPFLVEHKNFRELTGWKKDSIYNKNKFKVSPTASTRTLYIHNLEKDFQIKLHYPGILGRVNRELPYKKAIAGPELWKEIRTHIDNNEAPECLAFLPEIGARVWYPPDGTTESISFIIRDAEPYPNASNRFLIPFFSLFSQDINSKEDRLILFQMFDNENNVKEKIFKLILKPIIESYVFLVFELGILPEINAQNILLEISSDLKPTRIVLRDISRMEKNIYLRNQKKLNTKFKSGEYKTINLLKDKNYSEIRHSFSYDFKLGDYVLAEIIDCSAEEFGFDPISLDKLVSELFYDLSKENIEKYFPSNGMWYSHEKILLTKKRPYIKLNNPRFRRLK